jgi:hypothetical protein
MKVWDNIVRATFRETGDLLTEEEISLTRLEPCTIKSSFELEVTTPITFVIAAL